MLFFIWCTQITLIKLATSLVLQRLYVSRHHFGGPLWLPAPQTEEKPHSFHSPAAGSPGENFPEDSLSRCGDEGEVGHVYQFARSQSSGTHNVYHLMLTILGEGRCEILSALEWCAWVSKPISTTHINISPDFTLSHSPDVASLCNIKMVCLV